MVTKVNPRQVAGLKELNLSVDDIKTKATAVDGVLQTLRTDVDLHTNKFTVVDTDIQALKDRPIGGGGSTVVGGGSGGIDTIQLNALLKNTLEDAKSRTLAKFRSGNMVVDAFTDASGWSDVTPDTGVISNVVAAHPVMTSATTPAPYVITASSSPTDYPLKQIFDGTLAGWWQAGSNGWVQLDTNVAKCITKITITGFNWTSGSYAPRTFTFAGSNNGTTWTTLLNGVNPNNAVPTSYSFENPNSYRYHRLTIQDVHGSTSYSGLSDLKLYESISGVSFNTVSETLTKTAKYVYIYSMHSGTAKFELSLDNGNTWKEVQTNTLIDTSSYVSTNNLKIRVTQSSGFTMRGLSYVWYDEDSIKAVNNPYDPLMDSIMLNDTVNLIYSNFRSAEQRAVSKFAWKNFVIDIFKDMVGIDTANSHSGIKQETGQIGGAYKELTWYVNGNSITANGVTVTISTSTNASNAYAMFMDNSTELSSATGSAFWAKVDFGIPTKVTDYVHQGGADNYWNATGYTLEGSNDDVSYTVIDTRTVSYNYWNVRKNFTLASPVTYRYYKWSVALNQISSGSFKISRLLFLNKSNPLQVTTKSDITSGVPKRLVVVGETVGTATYQVSGDNGVSWTNVEANKMVDVSSIDFSSIKLRAVFADETTKLQSLGYAWFDGTSDSSSGSAIDPGTISRIENMEINLVKTNFRLATMQNAARYSLKNILIDDFNDASGIDNNMSSGVVLREKSLEEGVLNLALMGYGGTASTSYGIYSGSVNAAFDDNEAAGVVFSGRFGNITRTFVSPVSGVAKIEAIVIKPDTPQTMEYKLEANINGVWTTLVNKTGISTSSYGAQIRIVEEFAAVTSQEFRLYVSLSQDWVTILEFKIIKGLSDTKFVSTKEVVSVTPTKAMIVADIINPNNHTLMYEVSRDDGVTWTSMPMNVLTNISTQPEGKNLRVRISMGSKVVINSYGLLWT